MSSANNGFPLPDNVILNIFGRLPVHDLLALSATCHKFHRLVQNPVLWKNLACKHFLFVRKDQSLKPTDWSWKHFFKQLYTYDVTWENGYVYKKKLTGHLMSVNALYTSKLKHQVVSGSSDHKLILWDWKTGEQIRVFRGHSLAVRSVYMDETRIVSGSNDKTVRVWDPTSGECTAILEGHEDCVTCVRSDPKKNVIVSGSFDYTVKVWDATSGKCIATLTGHTNIVKCLCLRSHRIISGSVDATIKVWNIGASECMLTLKGHSDTVTCVESDNDKIVSGSHDRTIRLWNLRTGEPIKTLRMAGGAAMVETLAFDNAKIVAGTRNGSIYIFSLYTMQCSRIIDAHAKAVNCLQFHNKVVTSASADNTVMITRFSTKPEKIKVKRYDNKASRPSPYVTGSTKVPAEEKQPKDPSAKEQTQGSSAGEGAAAHSTQPSGSRSHRQRRAREAEKEVYNARQTPRIAFATPGKDPKSHVKPVPPDSGGRDPYGWGSKGPPKSRRVMATHEDGYVDGRKPWDATVTVTLDPLDDRPHYDSANPYVHTRRKGNRRKKPQKLAPLYTTHPPPRRAGTGAGGKSARRGGGKHHSGRTGGEPSYPFQEDPQDHRQSTGEEGDDSAGRAASGDEHGQGQEGQQGQQGQHTADDQYNQPARRGARGGGGGGRRGRKGASKKGSGGGGGVDAVEREDFQRELLALRERIARLEAAEAEHRHGASDGGDNSAGAASTGTGQTKAPGQSQEAKQGGQTSQGKAGATRGDGDNIQQQNEQAAAPAKQRQQAGSSNSSSSNNTAGTTAAQGDSQAASTKDSKAKQEATGNVGDADGAADKHKGAQPTGPEGQGSGSAGQDDKSNKSNATAAAATSDTAAVDPSTTVEDETAAARAEEEAEREEEEAAESERKKKEEAAAARAAEEAAAQQRLKNLEREREGFQQDLRQHAKALRSNLKSQRALMGEKSTFSFHFMCSSDVVEEVQPVMEREVWPDVHNYVTRDRPDLQFDQDIRPVGSTDRMAESSEVQLLRLDLVDACKPFFICVLGAECGQSILSWDKNILQSYPWLEDHVDSSMIEVEIYHGVLTVGRPLFYFLDYLDTPLEDRMEALRDRIKASGLPWVSISSPDQLAAEAAADVPRMLQYEYPPVEMLNGGIAPLDDYHKEYAINRATKTIMRKGALKRFTESVLNFGKAQTKPCGLYNTRPGGGCSTMIAQWLWENKALETAPKSDRFVFYHFAGVSRYAQSVENMAFRLIHACDKFMGIAGASLPYGYTTQEIVKELVPRLHGVANMTSHAIVFIDGFDQMDRHALDWLPPTLPSNLRIVFSVGSDTALTQEIRARGWTGHAVPQLSDKEVEHFTRTFLKNAQRMADDPDRKVPLTDDVLETLQHTILNAPKTRTTTALTLRLLCLMLTKAVQMGGKTTPQAHMKRFLVAKTPEHLYERLIAGIMAREEKNGSIPFFSKALQYTSQSMFGLSESDLLYITGVSRSRFTAAMRGYHSVMFNDIGDVSDLLNPNNSSLRAAINRVFFPSNLDEASKKRSSNAAGNIPKDLTNEVTHALLDHYANLVLPEEEATIDSIASAPDDHVMAQMACEMGYHLEALGDDARLATITLEPRVFRALSASSMKSDLVRWWVNLATARDPAKQTWALFEAIHSAHASNEVSFPVLRDYAIDIGDFLTVQFRFGGAEKFFLVALSLEARISDTLGTSNTKEQASIMGKVATVWRTHGMVEPAADYYFQAYEMYNELQGLSKETVDMLIGLGEVEIELSPESAESHLELAVTLLERLGLDSHPDYARCLNNLGLACKKVNKIDKAEDFYCKCLAIRLRTQGEWHPHTALVQRNLGSLLFTQQEFAEALELFQASLRTCQQVYGPIHPSTAASMEWVGGILTITGRKSEGEAMLKQAKIVRAQGERAAKKAHQLRPSTAASQHAGDNTPPPSAGKTSSTRGPKPPTASKPDGNRPIHIRDKVLEGKHEGDGHHVDVEDEDAKALAERPPSSVSALPDEEEKGLK